MIRILKSCKGAVSVYILSLFLIICVILPMLLVVIQRQAVLNSIDQVKDCIYMSAQSSYMALMPAYYTDKIVRLDEEVFKQKFTLLLNDNLIQSFGKAEIVEIKVYNENLPMQCPCYSNFNEPGVHALVTITLPAPAYRFLVPLNTGKTVTFKVHSDIYFSIID